QVVCHILHTAEFCRETLEGLATAVQKDIKPALADKVDLSEEEGSFQGVASACMTVLVLGINTKLDASLQDMGRVRWDMIDSPGDDSTYVLTMRKPGSQAALLQALLDSAPRLGLALDALTLSFLCDKMARAFLPRFHETLGRCKKISDKGTLQLSIDCDAIRRALHDFPKAARAAAAAKLPQHHADLLALQVVAALGPGALEGRCAAAGIKPQDETEDENGPFASYNTYVEREMGAAINTVKVLQSKPENLVSTFMLLMPANLQTPADFARVCDMKGLPRLQLQHLVGQYQAKLSGEEGEAHGSGAAGLAMGGAGAEGGLLGANLGAFKLNMVGGHGKGATGRGGGDGAEEGA
ncbi:hypothetical protein QJQ45_030391, partial [Haematococcus lacustris]